MKVKIKELEPNPYRDIKNYPIDKDKVKSLVESISQTGFWDNILARKEGNKYQIAYGHHRLMALHEVYKANDEIDIPVKKLDDSTMIKIMANENMEAWAALPKVIDETVRVTKQFLEEHPEEVKKLGHPEKSNKNDATVGVSFISRFLGWNTGRVSHSLERLRLIEDKIIDKEAVESLPTERSARDFVKSVKEMKLPVSKQMAAVKNILNEKTGELSVRNAVLNEKFISPKKRSEYQDPRIIKFESIIAETKEKAIELIRDLQKIDRLEKELGIVESDAKRKRLNYTLNDLSKQILITIKPLSNGKSKSSNSNLKRITI